MGVSGEEVWDEVQESRMGRKLQPKTEVRKGGGWLGCPSINLEEHNERLMTKKILEWKEKELPV